MPEEIRQYKVVFVKAIFLQDLSMPRPLRPNTLSMTLFFVGLSQNE